MAIIWLLAEFVMLSALRAESDGTFRFHTPGTDNVLGSLVMDMVLYLLSVGAPSFVLRFPGESNLDRLISLNLTIHGYQLCNK